MDFLVTADRKGFKDRIAVARVNSYFTNALQQRVRDEKEEKERGERRGRGKGEGGDWKGLRSGGGRGEKGEEREEIGKD